MTLKVPQIRQVLRAKATTGLSAMALYLDVFLYLNAAMYNITMGNPLSAWGELLIVIVQNIALVLLLWRYGTPAPSFAAKLGAVVSVAAHGVVSLNLPPEYRYLLPTLNLPCMIVTRIAQVSDDRCAPRPRALAHMTPPTPPHPAPPCSR